VVDEKLKTKWLDSAWGQWQELQHSKELEALVKTAEEKLSKSTKVAIKGKGKGPGLGSGQDS